MSGTTCVAYGDCPQKYQLMPGGEWTAAGDQCEWNDAQRYAAWLSNITVNPIDWSRKANTNIAARVERGLPTLGGTISAKEMRIAMAVAAAGIIAERAVNSFPANDLLSTTWSAMSGVGCRTATTPTTMARLRTDRPGLVTDCSHHVVRGECVSTAHKRFVSAKSRRRHFCDRNQSRLSNRPNTCP